MDERVYELIDYALQEDAGQCDVTSVAALPANVIARGQIVAVQPGIVAGLNLAEQVFHRVNSLAAFTPLVADGAAVAAGEAVATVVGPAVSVLTAERTALRFVARMSGVATLTRRYVEAVQGTQAVILGSHDSPPGLRTIDQWAIQLGGGGSSCPRLDQMILIRAGHAALADGLAGAVARARQQEAGLPIRIEARTWEELDLALPLEPDRIVLLGLAVADIADAVRWVAGRTELEAADDVTLENVRAVAQTGVDYINVRALTTQAGALAVSLIVEPAV